MPLAIPGRGPRGYGRSTRAFADRRHAWVRDRLVSAWLCDEGAGTALREFSGRGGQGALSATASWGSSDWGPALDMPGGGSRVSVPRLSNPRYVSTWQRFTVMALVRPGSFAGSLVHLVHFGGDTPITSSTGPWSFYLDDNTIASGMVLRVNSPTGVTDVKLANSVTPGIWQVLGFTVRRRLDSTTTVWRVTGYRDGRPVATSSNIVRTGTSPLSTDPTIGAKQDGTTSYAGRIAGVWLWDYGMDPGQVARFASDPFGAWRLDPTPFVAPAAGGGGGIGGGGVPAVLRRRHGGL